MRATGQARNLTGPLEPEEAKVVVARAILGEWLGGSGGGWQDSGGIFPGIKLIQGVAAAEGDPEWGVSRGRLLPDHRLLNSPHAPSSRRRPLHADSVPRGAGQEPGPRPRRDGPERRPDPQHGHRASICSAAATSGWPGSEALEIFDEIVGVRRSGRTSAASAADDPQLGRPAQADHPLGHQRVHRVDHPRGARRPWATTSGAS